MKKLVLETTAPFQGLPELVAYDEGLFAKEGLEIEWADREAGVEKKVEAHVTTPTCERNTWRTLRRSPTNSSCRPTSARP